MALRQLILTQEIKNLRAELASLGTAKAELEVRRAAWRTREEAAEAAFAEITDETPAEDRAAFDREAGEIEEENKGITADEEANEKRTGEVNEEIKKREDELEELNKRAKPPAKDPAGKTTPNGERKDVVAMNAREEVRAMVRDHAEVREFVSGVRRIRSVSGVDVTIPTVMLPMIRQAADRASKLKKYVNTSSVGGEANINVLGAAPEAVWTETTGKFNELDLTFNQLTMGGNKVAGYIAVPNPYLQDSDENLAAIIIDQLGQSIGYAEDKAIIYGTGTNMPVGIVTRLAAASQPAWWGAKQPTFTNLSTSNVGKLSANTVEGIAMFTEMVKVLGKAKEVYRNGESRKFWVMNEPTWFALQTAFIAQNINGAIVSGMNRTMPIIGGTVEILDFIPDNNIIGGYGSQYKWVNRHAMEIRKSEHVKFLDDQTVYAGVARADGKPIAGEGFAAFSLTTSAVTTSATFAEDVANAEDEA